VYPAMAVHQALTSNTEVLWVGSRNGMEERLVARYRIPYVSISAAGLHGVGAASFPRNLLLLANGLRESGRILKNFNPDVLFFTGGYIAAPMAVAGKNIPSLLYVPDIEPGMAIQFISRFSNHITVSTEDSIQYFDPKKEITVTGYPVRKDFHKWEDRIEACKTLGLDENLPVLMVYGGSKGARTINTTVLSILPDLLSRMQIIHLTGQNDWEMVQNRIPELEESQRSRYHAFEYLHEEMGAALCAANLVISRSGASTLGELPFFGTPAILIPYPFAWRYQHTNAEWLEKHGAAILLKDEDMATQLLSKTMELVSDPAQLEKMAENMRSLARPDSAAKIAAILSELAARTGQRRSSHG